MGYKVAQYTIRKLFCTPANCQRAYKYTKYANNRTAHIVI